MRVIACLLLTLFVSSALFGVCNGAAWFEGYNPQEPQEIRLNMQHIDKPNENTPTAPPACILNLSETEPHIVKLTIIVSTAAFFYQNENFQPWLSIDSQEPEKLFGILNSRGSAAGDEYTRQYTEILNGLGDGAHFIKIRVTGEYYGPEAGNYDCEGNATFMIDHQTQPPPTPFPTTIAVASVASAAVVAGVLLVYFKKHKPNALA
jgi:hypothetical protein